MEAAKKQQAMLQPALVRAMQSDVGCGQDTVSRCF